MSEKKEIPSQRLEEEIKQFLHERATTSGGRHTEPGCNLKHGYACVLATCHDDIPRATPVDFFCDGTLAVWINAEPGGKIANIMRNPHVSLGIYERVNHSVEQKSMQLWGRAEIITAKNNPAIMEEKWEQFGLNEAMAGMLDKRIGEGMMPESAREQAAETIKKKINLIKIIPGKIVLLHMMPDRLPIKKFWENGKAFVQDVGG